MKHQRKRWLGLAIVPALLALLSLAAPAYATDYTCADVPTNPSGNTVVGTAGTPCSIPAAGVNASTGSLTILGSTITTTGPLAASNALAITGTSTINVKALTGASVNVQTGTANVTTTNITSTSGNIDVSATGVINTRILSGAQHVDLDAKGTTGDAKVTGALTANNGYVQVRAGRLVKITGAVKSVANGNILITAKTTLATGAITGAPGSNVDLKANVSGGTSAFVINPSTGTPVNGVKGKINASNGSTVYVTNGSSTSASPIALTTNTDIAISGTVSNRYIILNANNGTINLPTGILSVDGSGATGAAGQIQLLAQTVAFADNSGLSAKQQSSAAGSLHGIAIAAKFVSYGGSTGLTLAADGNGNNPGAAFVYLLPQGATTITDGQDVNNLFITVSNSLFGASNPITYTANSTASPLMVTANGDNSFIGIYAYPVKFVSGGAVTFQAQGNLSHKIFFSNVGTLTNVDGLVFGGIGALTIDASAVASGKGGDIAFSVDKMPISASSVSLNANGPTGGTNGDGGTIFVGSQNLSTSSTSTVTVTANASTSGTGNAVAGDPLQNVPKAIQLYLGACPKIRLAGKVLNWRAFSNPSNC